MANGCIHHQRRENAYYLVLASAGTGILPATSGNRLFTVTGDSIPEPSTVLLFGGGLLAYSALRFRTRRLG